MYNSFGAPYNTLICPAMHSVSFWVFLFVLGSLLGSSTPTVQEEEMMTSWPEVLLQTFAS